MTNFEKRLTGKKSAVQGSHINTGKAGFNNRVGPQFQDIMFVSGKDTGRMVDVPTVLQMQSVIGNRTTIQLLRQSHHQEQASSSVIQRGFLEELKARRGGLKEQDATPDYVEIAKQIRQKINGTDGPKYLKSIAKTKDDSQLAAFIQSKWDVLAGGAAGVARYTGPNRNNDYADKVFSSLRKLEKAELLDLVSVEEGGRNFSMDPDEVSNYMVGLAEHIANFMNDHLDNASVRIAGSVGVMKADPWKFLADDIDLDYYDKKANEPGSEARWNKALEVFKTIPPHKTGMGVAIAGDATVEGTHNELVKSGWTLDTGEIIRTVEVEMKNVSGAAWHTGLKERRRRELGEGPWLPETQLYLDVCSRVVDLIFQAKDNDEIKDKPKAVQAAAKEKSIFLKKKILEDSLGDNGLQAARELAERKLTDERFAIWELVSSNEALGNIFAKLSDDHH